MKKSRNNSGWNSSGAATRVAPRHSGPGPVNDGIEKARMVDHAWMVFVSKLLGAKINDFLEESPEAVERFHMLEMTRVMAGLPSGQQITAEARYPGM